MTTCQSCSHFESDPSVIEREYAGLTAMSSGFASVRAGDGLCRRHDLYLSGSDTCPSHLPKTTGITPFHLKEHHEKFAELRPSPANQDHTSSRSLARRKYLLREAEILEAPSSHPEQHQPCQPSFVRLVDIIKRAFHQRNIKHGRLNAKRILWSSPSARLDLEKEQRDKPAGKLGLQSFK